MKCKTHPASEAVSHIRVACIECDDAEVNFFCPECREALRAAVKSKRDHPLVSVDHPIEEHCFDPEALFTPEGCVLPSMDETLEEIIERAAREAMPAGAPA